MQYLVVILSLMQSKDNMSAKAVKKVELMWYTHLLTMMPHNTQWYILQDTF